MANSHTLAGQCHCGAVTFTVQAELPLQLIDCNCSICNMTGYLHLTVAGDALTINSGEDNLCEYRFGTKTARHFFCGTCGVKPFYVPRSHPDGWSVNARCLKDQALLEEAVVMPFDGSEWEKNVDSIR